MTLAENNHYKQAAEQFYELGDYKDSEEQLIALIRKYPKLLKYYY
jgi:TolA-binding protein